MKNLLWLIPAFVVLLIAYRMSILAYNKDHPESVAFKMVERYCQSHSYKTSNLEGPTAGLHIDGVYGGKDFSPAAAYTWVYSEPDKKRFIELGVWFDADYVPTLMVWDGIAQHTL